MATVAMQTKNPVDAAAIPHPHTHTHTLKKATQKMLLLKRCPCRLPLSVPSQLLAEVFDLCRPMIASPASKVPLHASVERQGGYHILGALIVALPAEVRCSSCLAALLPCCWGRCRVDCCLPVVLSVCLPV